MTASRLLTRLNPKGSSQLSVSALLIRWVPFIPVLLAGGYSAWLVSRFSEVIAVIHLNPDAAWAPVLAADLGSPGSSGGSIFVGEASHLTTIWFLALTRSIPFREQIWDWAPYVIYLSGLGLTAWACRRVAGSWPAVLTVALGLAAGATVLLTVLVEGIRGHTFFANALACAFLVWAVRQDRSAGWKRALAGILTVAIVGSTVASDPLFLAVGLAPFAVAPVALWLARPTRSNRRLALTALALSGVALVLSNVIWRIAGGAGFQKNYLQTGYEFATPRQVLTNISKFATHFLGLTNSYFLAGDGAVRVGRIAMALLVALVLINALLLILRLWRSKPDAEPEDSLVIYLSFWLLSIGGTFAAFALSSFPAGPSDSARYAIPAFLSLAAIAPLWARRRDWRRVCTAAGTGLFCVLSIAARQDVFIYETAPGFKTLLDEGPGIVSYLEREGLTRGYGGYFTSHPLTLMSESKVHVYPVIACRQPASDALCPFSVNTRSSWYRPTEGRSFLVHDTAALPIIAPGPTSDLGPPLTQEMFGSISVSVYDYDLARTFLPPCVGTSTFFCPPP